MELTLPAAVLPDANLLCDDERAEPVGAAEEPPAEHDADPEGGEAPAAASAAALDEETGPVPCLEPLSPFLGYHDDERELPEELVEAPLDPGLLVDILRNPAAVCARLLDPVRIVPTVVGAAVLVPACASFFAVVTMTPWADGADIAKAAWMVPANLLLSLAVALGPTWGVSVLMAVRVPVARLVASMLAAVAAGALVLVALSPVPHALWKLDDHWAGPISLLVVFASAGMIAGSRLKRLLLETAQEVTRRASGDPSARLSETDAFRVGVLARMGMVALAFAGSLAVWAFNPFG